MKNQTNLQTVQHDEVAGKTPLTWLARILIAFAIGGAALSSTGCIAVHDDDRAHWDHDHHDHYHWANDHWEHD